MNTISSSKEAATILHPFFKGLDHEEIWILIVKGKEPVTSMKICSGDQASVAIDKKRIAKEVLLNDGDGLILFHNHPLNHKHYISYLIYSILVFCHQLNNHTIW